MEIEITDFYNNANFFNYSANRIELGQDAGKITWDNSLNCEYSLLDSEQKILAAKDFIRGFGGWDDDEINSWDHSELNALIVQFISGDIRESCLENDPCNWLEYYTESGQGNNSGRLFYVDDGKIYYNMYA